MFSLEWKSEGVADNVHFDSVHVIIKYFSGSERSAEFRKCVLFLTTSRSFNSANV